MRMIRCKGCDRIIEHEAKGFCRNCYMRLVFNPTHVEYRKEYRRTHRAKINAYHKEYVRKHKDKIYQQNLERYHKGKSNTISIYNRGNQQYYCYGTGKPVHQVIAEKILGRKLKRGECVHHIDHNSLNNAHNNLLICRGGFHKYLHYRPRGVALTPRA